MISLHVIFWMYIILFAIIGAMRGWAKELLVTFSVILAVFIMTVLESFVPFVKDVLASKPEAHFWVRTSVLAALVFFGYQSPNISRLATNNRFARDRVQDILLGMFMGALNGYLVVGSFWWFMADANYATIKFIEMPPIDSERFLLLQSYIQRMPPEWLQPPVIYFAVALAFVFVLVVFL